MYAITLEPGSKKIKKYATNFINIYKSNLRITKPI